MKRAFLNPNQYSTAFDFLMQDTACNLYQIDLLQRIRQNPFALQEWKAIWEGTSIRGLSLSTGRLKHGTPSGLSVSYGDEDACRILGEWERECGGTRRILGQRTASDAFYEGLGRPETEFSYDERLYVCSGMPGDRPFLSLRPARSDELHIVEPMAALMQEEDLGYNPKREDPEQHLRSVAIRIMHQRILVGEVDSEIVFIVEVGTHCSLGSQVGSAYVPPKFRRQGLGVRGMRGCCDYLLRDSAIVTLIARESNTAAIRTHIRAGYSAKNPFRMTFLR